MVEPDHEQMQGNLCIVFPDKTENVVPVYHDESIWHILQSIRDLSPMSNDECPYNFGFYSEPIGKFLSEEICIGEAINIYQKPSPVVEYKPKKNVISGKQGYKSNSKSSQKKFYDHVQLGNLAKIQQLLESGLDANFLNDESGESPLTFCASSESPGNASIVIGALIKGGAITHYRNKDGFTPVHKAVVENQIDALRTLLSMGASPNSMDCRNLMPLILACQIEGARSVCEVLLRERAMVGCTDRNGWTELHHSAKLGIYKFTSKPRLIELIENSAQDLFNLPIIESEVKIHIS